jgi:hypothetical protein
MDSVKFKDNKAAAGWSKDKPHSLLERKNLLKKNKNCFLKPDDMKYPVCDKNANFDCRGIIAAKFWANTSEIKHSKKDKKTRKKRPYSFKKISIDATNLGKKLGCKAFTKKKITNKSKITNRIKIFPSEFKQLNKSGDFLYEIKQNLEPKTLYIFNDNNRDHYSDIIGGGNAVIRQFNNKSSHNPPRSAGICTGESPSGGFPKLTSNVKKIIDRDIKEIQTLLDTKNYNAVKFSSDGKGGLGTAIFSPGEDVKKYIVSKIYSLY